MWRGLSQVTTRKVDSGNAGQRALGLHRDNTESYCNIGVWLRRHSICSQDQSVGGLRHRKGRNNGNQRLWSGNQVVSGDVGWSRHVNECRSLQGISNNLISIRETARVVSWQKSCRLQIQATGR